MSRQIKKVIQLSNDELTEVDSVMKSRVQTHTAVRNATILYMAHDGNTPTQIASTVNISKQSVHNVLNKYLKHGLKACWSDLKRSGRPATISDEARCYVVDLACDKPTSFGYPHELWSINLLKEHIQKNCAEKGFSELSKISKSTVWEILNKRDIKPHKIKYYLERTDENFEEHMKNVLMLYKEVNITIEQGNTDDCYYVSYDEKPGIQALSNIYDDKAPTAEHGFVARDYEYKRHGTLSLLAGIDLVTGKVLGLVRERHRSFEFVEFLNLLDETYPKGKIIKVVLDNHRAHSSKETQAYLQSKPNRFEFVFTPKHGSWLNMIESWFGKLARTLLRGIRVESKSELERRILEFIEFINEDPVVPRWKYKMDEIDV